MMNDEFCKKTEQLKELAAILNSFESEAVQLRLLDYLLSGVEGEDGNSLQSQETRSEAGSKKKKKKKKTKNPKTSNSITSDQQSKPSKKTTSPAALINAAYEEGIFKTPQTIGSITEHLKHTKGHTLKANQVSPALLRLLRNEKVTRTQNEDGQYEYTET